MNLLKPEQYREIMREKGLRPSWVASQVGITYAYLNAYFNKKKIMAQHRIEKLHQVLVGLD